MPLTRSLSALRRFAATALVSVPIVCSCVNEEYDFTGGIDGSVDIQGSISLPLGNTEFMPIGDFLELDQEDQESILTVDPQTGDYRFYITSDETIAPAPVKIPQIGIDGSKMFPDGGVLYEDIGIGSLIRDIIKDLPQDQDIPESVSSALDGLIDGMEPMPEASTPIKLDEDISQITSIVKAINNVGLDAPVELAMSIKGENIKKGKVTISGVDDNPFTISFPDFVKLVPESENINVESGHVLSFDRLQLDVENPAVFRLNISSIDMPSPGTGQGMVGDKLFIDNEITISKYKIDLELNDFAEKVSEIPDKIAVDLRITVSDVLVSSILAGIHAECSAAPPQRQIGELPEFISGEEVTLDLYNPVIRLEARASDNTVYPGSFPVFRLSANLDAFGKDGTTTMESPIRLGDSQPIEIQEGINHIIISRREMPSNEDPVPEGEYYEYVVIDNLSDIVRTVPSYIEIGDISVSVPHVGNETDGWKESDYTTVVFPEQEEGKESQPLVYDVGMDYSMEFPLAFGKDLDISYSTDFNGWNESFSSTSDADYTLDFREATIKFDFINSIPLNLGLSADAIDVDGEIMDDINVSLDGTLAAGNIGSETHTSIVVRIQAAQEALDRFDGLRLNISAKAGADMEGTPLNEKQGVRLESIRANVQGGVHLDINSDQNN